MWDMKAFWLVARAEDKGSWRRRRTQGQSLSNRSLATFILLKLCSSSSVANVTSASPSHGSGTGVGPTLNHAGACMSYLPRHAIACFLFLLTHPEADMREGKFGQI